MYMHSPTDRTGQLLGSRGQKEGGQRRSPSASEGGRGYNSYTYYSYVYYINRIAIATINRIAILTINRIAIITINVIAIRGDGR